MTTAIEQLSDALKPGRVYRRQELARYSNAVDRHLKRLVNSKALKKLSTGLYYAPKKGAFGDVAPDDQDVVRAFLKDDRFLVTSLNAYNTLGLGLTQLHNERLVYNHKRHGTFRLGKRKYTFVVRPYFPDEFDEYSLLVDLVNNLDRLGEDPDELMDKVLQKARSMDAQKLYEAAQSYGLNKARKMFTAKLPHQP